MVRLKKLPAFICLIMAIFFSGVVWAQIGWPAGEASLTIQMGSEKKTFTFPKALPTITMAVQNASTTDITYSRFMDDKEMEYVDVHLRIQPNGLGNFIMTDIDNTIPPNNVTIGITYRKKNANFELKELILSGEGGEGESGTAVITQYAVGSDLIGSFQGTLRDINSSGTKGNLYEVSGNFKIKLTKE